MTRSKPLLPSSRLDNPPTGGRTVALETAVIEVPENHEHSYPHCVIPEGFFDAVLAREPRRGGIPLLTIESLDGRNVFSVKRHH